MKKLIPLILILSVTVYMGCGGDDEITDPGGGNTPPARVTVNNNVASAPSIDDANDPVWDQVTPTAITLKKAVLFPQSISTPSAVAVSADIQAIINNNFLYLRLVWSDVTHNIWKQNYTNISSGGFPEFNRQDTTLENEDKFLVFIDGVSEGVHDVWFWRSLTTAYSGFAEGGTFFFDESFQIEVILDTIGWDTAVDTLNDTVITAITESWDDTTFLSLPTIERDAAGSKQFEMVIENHPIFGDPTYAHQDTSEFNSPYLLLDEKIHRLNDPASIRYDTIQTTPVLIVDTIPNYWPTTAGWSQGQRVPGWMVEDTAKFFTDAELGSRWDIRCATHYDSTMNEYTVVFRKAMGTTYSDDIDLATADSLRTRLVISNNQASIYNADTWRSISDAFWIIMP